MTSLGTALLPGQHGLVGFSARIPGTDRLINHLLWEKSVDPVEWQPHPTAFAALTERGAHVTAINKRAFSGSGLTVAAHRGADVLGLTGLLGDDDLLGHGCSERKSGTKPESECQSRKAGARFKFAAARSIALP